jgi:hypothetical protein
VLDDEPELRLPPSLERVLDPLLLLPLLLLPDDRDPRSTLLPPELRLDPLLAEPLPLLDEPPSWRGRMRAPPTLSITRRDGALDPLFEPLDVLLPGLLDDVPLLVP